MIDPKTEHTLHKIAESVYKDPMKLVKDEFHEEQIELAKDTLRRTETSDKNSWSQEENRQAREAAELVLKRLDGTHQEIDSKKARELDERLEVRVRQAIRDGKIKPDTRDYRSYMQSLYEKSHRVRRGR